MPSLRKPERNKHYLIVEGEREGQAGRCVGSSESGFGRIWIDLEMADMTVIRKRLSDVRTREELEEALKEKAADGSL